MRSPLARLEIFMSQTGGFGRAATSLERDRKVRPDGVA